MSIRYQKNIYYTIETFTRNKWIQVPRLHVIPYTTFIYRIKVLLNFHALSYLPDLLCTETMLKMKARDAAKDS
jgi:hypothetical protein